MLPFIWIESVWERTYQVDCHLRCQEVPSTPRNLQIVAAAAAAAAACFAAAAAVSWLSSLFRLLLQPVDAAQECFTGVVRSSIHFGEHESIF